MASVSKSLTRGLSGESAALRLGLALVLSVSCSEHGVVVDANPPILANPPTTQPLEIEERFVQVVQPQVDLLFVVDNSSSMAEEQAKLGSNFPSLLSWIVDSGVDYHIGVTTTEALETPGRLRWAAGKRYLDDGTPEPRQVFSQMVSLGTNGDTTERGRHAAYAAIELDEQGINAGFYRHTAAFHVIFVSDGDDGSSATNPVTVAEYYQWMATKKGAPDIFKSHGIVSRVSNPTEACEMEDAGWAYINYATATGGQVEHICNDSWSAFMDNVGLEVAGRPREFFLAQMPVLDPLTLEVWVRRHTDDGVAETFHPTCLGGLEEQEPECEVAYNALRNSVVFLDAEDTPESLDEVVLRYQPRGN